MKLKQINLKQIKIKKQHNTNKFEFFYLKYDPSKRILEIVESVAKFDLKNDK
jgi:hypothetical protein